MCSNTYLTPIEHESKNAEAKQGKYHHPGVQ